MCMWQGKQLVLSVQFPSPFTWWQHVTSFWSTLSTLHIDTWSVLSGTLWLVLWLFLVLVLLVTISALLHWLVHAYRWLCTPCYRNIPFAGKPKELSWWKYLLNGHASYAAMLASPGDIARWFLDTRDKLHSPVFSYCFMFLDPRIALVSPEAAKHVMVKNVHNYIKPPMVRRGLANLLGNKGILLAEGEDHARQRRIILPAFHFQALVPLGHLFRTQGQVVTQRWLQQSKQQTPVDVHLDMTQVTMNVIALAAFGYDPNTDSGQELYRAYRDIFTQRPPSRMLSMLFSLLPAWLLRNIPLSRLMQRQQSNVRLVKKKVTEMVQQRRQEYEAFLKKKNGAGDKSSRDLLDILVAARDPEMEKKSAQLPYLTDEEITSQALTFMAAGQVTTAVLLSWTLFELSIHPRAQEKLREELQTLKTDTTSQSSSSPQSDADLIQRLDKLEYLDAVLRESLRLHPPVLFVTRQAAQDDEIIGFPISQGAIVNIPIVALHRDPEQWGPDADRFYPERFLLSKDKSNASQRHPMSWLPFLYGTRACTGQRFAMLEAKMILFELLTRVAVRLQPGCEVKGYGMVSVPRDVRLQVYDLYEQ